MSFRDLPVPKATTPPESTVLPSVPDEKNQGSISIVEIPLDRVLESVFQPRRQNTTKKDMEDLAKNIAANGHLQPIIVTPADGENAGKYNAQSGHRRCAALRSLGLSTVKAIIRADLTPREARKIAIADNLGREDLSAFDLAMSFKDYCEQNALDFKKGAEDLGLTRRQALRLEAVLKASPELLDVLCATAISARVAEHLAKIDAGDSKLAIRLARRFADGEVMAKAIEEKAESQKQPAKKQQAIKDVDLKTDPRRIRLAINVARGDVAGSQRERVISAISEFIGHVGIAEVTATQTADEARP